MAHGDICTITDSHFIWKIHDFLVFRKNFSYFFSPDFVFKEHTWFLQAIGRKTESGHLIIFKICRKKIRRTDPCVQTYRMYIRDANGGRFWDPPVVAEEFSNKKLDGIMQDLSIDDIVQCQLRIAPVNVMCLHLEFDPTINGKLPTQPAGVVSFDSSPGSLRKVVGKVTSSELPAKPTASSSSSGGVVSTDSSSGSLRKDVGKVTFSELPVKPTSSSSSSGGVVSADIISCSCAKKDAVRTETSSELPPKPSDSSSSDGVASTDAILVSFLTDVGTETSSDLQPVPSDSSGSSGVTSDDDASFSSRATDVGMEALQPRSNRSSSADGVDTLLEDLKHFLLNEQNADVTLKVRGTEFKAHKAFLVARSPEFGKMLDSELLDDISGSVEISDCDPEDFRAFLLYLYTGRVEKPTVRTVAELYCLSARYSIAALRSYCVWFLLSNLTVESFCDIVSVGLRHNSAELSSSVNDFFAKNMKQIVRTDEWKSFSTEKPAEAHEFMINALSEDKVFLEPQTKK